MKVGEFMTPSPICVEHDCAVREVVDEIMGADIRHIPIVDKGCLLGMISDRDLQSHALPIDIQEQNLQAAVDRLDTAVVEIMQDDVVSVTRETGLTEVMDIMIQNKLGALPVVSSDENQLVGIVSYIDVLKAVRNSAA